MSQMPSNDPDQVRAWIEGKVTDLETKFSGRNLSWSFDRALLLQAYREEIPDFPQVLSAEPRNQFRLALDIMTLRPPRISVETHYQEALEQDMMGELEMFCWALFREISQRHRQAGNRNWLRDLVWYVLCGGFAVNPLVLRPKRGETRFLAQVWDPMEVYPEYDENGLKFVVRRYKSYARNIRAMALPWKGSNGFNAQAIETLKDNDEGDVTNAFWLEEDGPDEAGVYNCILAHGAIIKPPTLEKQFGMRIPVIIGPSAGTPFRAFHGLLDWPSKPEGYDWTAYAWDGLLAPARLSFTKLDSLLSDMATIVHKTAEGAYVQKTLTGLPRLDPQKFRKMQLGTLKVGEELIPVAPPSSPREREELLSFLIGSIQRSGLSFPAFGQLGLEISGVTVESLINATQAVLSPYIESAQYVVEQTLLSLVEQYRQGRFKAVELSTKGSTRPMDERWFIREFSRDKLPKTANIKIILPLALPDTKLARIQALRAAFGDNRPLFSSQTGMEKLLEDVVSDQSLERQRIVEDIVDNSPEGRTLQVLEGLQKKEKDYRARGQIDRAELVRMLMDRTMQALTNQLMGGGQATENMLRQRQIQGTPVTEPSPENMPPEAGGVRPEELAGPGKAPVAGNLAVKTLLEKRARSMAGAAGG